MLPLLPLSGIDEERIGSDDVVVDEEQEFEKRGFSGGWIARADLPPLTQAEAAARARRMIPAYTDKVRKAEDEWGPSHPMTDKYRQILDTQRRTAEGS